MGVYPTVEYRDVNTGQLLSRDSLVYKQAWYEIGTLDYALYFVRLVVADVVLQERKTCYCCSCDGSIEFGSSTDPYCRNHGWAGARPCEEHDQPGSAGDNNTMPQSVQQVRARRRQEAPEWTI